METDELGPRAQRVYQALKARILSGEWVTGLQLPPYPQLANQLGVSPETMRRAIRQLRLDGLVSIELGRGTFVRTPVRERVLIVEQDADERASLRRALQDLELECVESTNAAEARQSIEANPTLMLIIAAIPDSDECGAFVRYVRQRQPALAMAIANGSAMDLEGLRNRQDSPSLMVSKPYQPRQIEEACRYALLHQTRNRPGPPPPAQEGLPPICVLIADGDGNGRSSTRALIAGMGHGVEEVESSAQMLLALQRVTFTHILVDASLPGGSLDFTQTIAAAYPSTLIVVTEYTEAAARLGRPIVVLRKPFVEENVREALELRRVVPRPPPAAEGSSGGIPAV